MQLLGLLIALRTSSGACSGVCCTRIHSLLSRTRIVRLWETNRKEREMVRPDNSDAKALASESRLAAAQTTAHQSRLQIMKMMLLTCW